MNGRVILAIVLLGLGAAAYFTVDTVMGNRTAEAQAIAKKKQAEADAKRSAAKKAADERKKAEADKEAAQLKLAETTEAAVRAKADIEAQKLKMETEQAALARAKAERGAAADARVILRVAVGLDDLNGRIAGVKLEAETTTAPPTWA